MVGYGGVGGVVEEEDERVESAETKGRVQVGIGADIVVRVGMKKAGFAGGQPNLGVLKPRQLQVWTVKALSC